MDSLGEEGDTTNSTSGDMHQTKPTKASAKHLCVQIRMVVSGYMVYRNIIWGLGRGVCRQTLGVLNDIQHAGVGRCIEDVGD